MLESFARLNLSLLSIAQVVLPSGYNPAAANDDARTIAINAWNTTDALNASSTPVPKEMLALDLTLDGGGSFELDLSDAPIIGAQDGSGNPVDGEDLDGHKPFYVEISTIRDSGTNAGDITVAPSASNGFELFGAGNEIDLPPDSKLILYVKGSSLADIDNAGDRLITFSGTAGDKVRVKMVFES